MRRRRQFNRRLALVLALPTALLCGALAGCERAPGDDGKSEPARASTSEAMGAPAPPEPRPVTAAEMAVVSPLQQGASLGEWSVRAIHGVERGVLRVVCKKGRSVVRLSIALAADDGPAPPATAGRYAIFYSLKGATPEEGESLAKELASVVKLNVSAEPPPGMTPFAPQPEEPISL